MNLFLFLLAAVSMLSFRMLSYRVAANHQPEESSGTTTLHNSTTLVKKSPSYSVRLVTPGGSLPHPNRRKLQTGQCNRNSDCPNSSCCSAWGLCGTGSDYCGTNDYGTCGSGKTGNGICPNSKQCCSKWGWCGTTNGHCNQRAPVNYIPPTASQTESPTTKLQESKYYRF